MAPPDSSDGWFEPGHTTEVGVPPPGVVEDDSVVVLLVDSNRVTRRYCEMALSAGGAHILLASTIAEALETLAATPADVVVAAGRLQDGAGTELLRRLTTKSQRRVPFVIVSADERVASKIAAFHAGVDDYLVKPFDADELVARVTALAVKARAQRTASPRTAALSGDLSALPFADLVTMLELGQRSGVLEIASLRAGAMVYFDSGRVVHTVYGTVVGLDAFARLLAQRGGQFEFIAGAALPVEEHTIQLSTTGLILECARRLDEEQNGIPNAGVQWPARHHSGPVRVGGARVAATIPSVAAANQAMQGILERWTPGDLHLMAPGELRDFTRGQGSGIRIHIQLVADIAEGVAALMSQSAPPAEREITRALSGEPLALALAMHHRDRMLDIVLVDASRPTAFVDQLQRVPSLLIIAPPGGDLAQLSPRARVEIDALADAVTPTTVLGIGSASLEDYFRAFASLRKGGALAGCMPGPLGATGLRSVLTKGLRIWATATSWQPSQISP